VGLVSEVNRSFSSRKNNFLKENKFLSIFSLVMKNGEPNEEILTLFFIKGKPQVHLIIHI
jgi:hypothetical protein